MASPYSNKLLQFLHSASSCTGPTLPPLAVPEAGGLQETEAGSSTPPKQPVVWWCLGGEVRNLQFLDDEIYGRVK